MIHHMEHVRIKFNQFWLMQAKTIWGVITLEGAAQMIDNQVVTLVPEMQSSQSLSLQESVHQTLQQYIAKLDGQTPANLYNLVLAEVEKPLIEMVLNITNNNQSKAAIILGISRGTLRKKMAIYDLN